MLKLLFPELYRFSQPLGRMIAGKIEYFKRIKMKKDYGVDIGILIDMDNLSARIEEVNIGTIEHDSKELVSLKQMSLEVASVILEKNSKI